MSDFDEMLGPGDRGCFQLGNGALADTGPLGKLCLTPTELNPAPVDALPERRDVSMIHNLMSP